MSYNLYPPYKKWGENGKIWLISDTHFNDYDESEWLPADKILENINRVVEKNDTLICLGDCGDARLFKDISCGYKVLIKGNHDEEEDDYYLKNGGFDMVFSEPLYISDRLLLSHEPVYGQVDCLNIHGHMHTGKHKYTDEMGGRHINIVGPAVNYQPLELGKLIKMGEIE